jgi:DNA-binding NtrC family response regulator
MENQLKSGKKIAIVDDMLIVALMLKEFLEPQGFNTFAFDDPEKALRDISANGMDIVIADLHMPGMTGLELLEKIEAVVPSVKGIIMSGDRKNAAELRKRYPFVDKENNLFESVAEAIGRL